MAIMGEPTIYTMSSTGVPSVSGPSLIGSVGSIGIESISSSPSTAPTMLRTASYNPLLQTSSNLNGLNQISLTRDPLSYTLGNGLGSTGATSSNLNGLNQISLTRDPLSYTLGNGLGSTGAVTPIRAVSGDQISLTPDPLGSTHSIALGGTVRDVKTVSPTRAVSGVSTLAATSLGTSILAPTSAPVSVMPAQTSTVAMAMPMNSTKAKALAILRGQHAQGRVILNFPKGEENEGQRVVSKEILRRHSALFLELLQQAEAQQLYKKAQAASKEGQAAQLSSLADMERKIAEKNEEQAESLKEALEGGSRKESEDEPGGVTVTKVHNPTIEYYKQQAAAHNARAEQYDKFVENAEKEAEKKEEEEPLELYLDRSDELFDAILEWMCNMEVSSIGSQCALETLKEKDEMEILRLLVEADFYEVRDLVSQCKLVLTWKKYEEAKEEEEEGPHTSHVVHQPSLDYQHHWWSGHHGYQHHHHYLHNHLYHHK